MRTYVILKGVKKNGVLTLFFSIIVEGLIASIRHFIRIKTYLRFKKNLSDALLVPQ